uniref:transposase n=1 Tax=Bifidobacterium longum TaxID=216816 RepID=UPI0029903139
NVSVLVAIGVDDTGHREVVGVAEGMKEDRASWEQFVRSLIERGLRGVRLVVGDRCAGLVATVNSMLPDARYQRCTVHFMRNVLSRVSRKHAAWAAGALKAVFAMESRDAALRKAEDVAAQMESRDAALRKAEDVAAQMESRDAALRKAEDVAAQMESRGLKAAASCLREGIGESTTYLLDDYPVEHRRRIRTNNMIERLNREIRRRTRVVGSFPDGRSALMLVCARIRYVTANDWSSRRYLNMSRLGDTMQTTD